LKHHLQQFMATKRPSYGQALSTLRLVFVAMFAAQVAVALVIAGLVRLFLTGGSASALVSQVLVVIALPYLPLTLLLTQRSTQQGGKQAAVSATLLSAVLLATPAWLFALALIMGSSLNYLLILLAIIALHYALGFLLCGRFAQVSQRVDPLSSQNDNQPDETMHQADS
jgi:hypothetical protein